MSKNNRPRNYQEKLPQKIKDEIVLQLILKIKTPAQLSKEYNRKPTTIYSYLKAKGRIYQPLEEQIFKTMKQWLEMLTQVLIRKHILFQLQMEGFLQYSDINPFLGLIPFSKRNSKRQRLLNTILQQCLSYYNQLGPYQNQSSFQQNQSSFEQNQSSFQQNQSSFEQNQSSFQQNQSSFQQNQSSFQQNQSSFSQNQSSFEQNQSSFQQNQSSFQQNQSSFEQNQSSFEQNWIESENQNQDVDFPTSNEF